MDKVDSDNNRSSDRLAVRFHWCNKEIVHVFSVVVSQYPRACMVNPSLLYDWPSSDMAGEQLPHSLANHQRPVVIARYHRYLRLSAVLFTRRSTPAVLRYFVFTHNWGSERIELIFSWGTQIVIPICTIWWGRFQTFAVTEGRLLPPCQNVDSVHRTVVSS